MATSASVFTFVAIGLFAVGSHAAGDLTRQEPVAIEMQLGTDKDEHRFVPDRLSLETGKLYALKLKNPSKNSYYFNSPGLADAVFTRKVVVKASDGAVLGEVYGAVRRLELKPGATVEWWFVPLRTGEWSDLESTKAHTEAGMRGKVEIR